MLYERQFIVAPEAGSRTFRMTGPRSRRQKKSEWCIKNIVFYSGVADPYPFVFGSPGPEPLLRGTDPDPTPDPSLIMQIK